MTVIAAGGVFSIKVPGLLGVPYHHAMMCPAKFQDGQLSRPAAICAAMVKEQSAYFQPGLKVYISKIEASSKGDKLSLTLIACDECNNTDPKSYYKTQIAFHFSKGFLDTAQAPMMEELIGRVLAPAEAQGAPQPSAAQAAPPQAAPPQAPSPQAAPPPITPPPAPAEVAPPPIAPPPPPADQPAVEIKIGQTKDQVTAALGQPKRIANLGPKQIYYYPDLKIVFVNGKVSDVQ